MIAAVNGSVSKGNALGVSNNAVIPGQGGRLGWGPFNVCGEHKDAAKVVF